MLATSLTLDLVRDSKEIKSMTAGHSASSGPYKYTARQRKSISKLMRAGKRAQPLEALATRLTQFHSPGLTW